MTSSAVGDLTGLLLGASRPSRYRCASLTMGLRAVRLHNESNDGILPKAGEIGINIGFRLLIFLLLDAVMAASGLRRGSAGTVSYSAFVGY